MTPEIAAAWVELENKIIDASKVDWRADYEWLTLYKVLIVAAKEHPYLQNYFPLTSHYCLRFSVDKHLHESWPFFYSIEPSYDLEKGKYQVHTSLNSEDTRHFDDVYSALDYLADWMHANKPIRWKD